MACCTAQKAAQNISASLVGWHNAIGNHEGAGLDLSLIHIFLTLDREKQFEVPELTTEIMERLAGYTLVGFHVKEYPVTLSLIHISAGTAGPASPCSM